MFQCLGLGSEEDGGCGEDWWHPECLVGMDREEWLKELENMKSNKKRGPPQTAQGEGTLTESTATIEREPITVGPGVDGNNIAADGGEEEGDDDDDDGQLPPCFPKEDDFDHFICYKCVSTQPWIKKYAGTEGFLLPVYTDTAKQTTTTLPRITEPVDSESKKRKADDVETETDATALPIAPPKRQKSVDPTTLSSIPEDTTSLSTPKKQDSSTCKLTTLPPVSLRDQPFSLFLKEDFRDHFCRCASCFPLLKAHPQLLEEEETYEPPVSEEGNDNPGSVGTGSIYDRGEAAFSNMDRVRAIQGAMAYAHLKDNLKSFLQPFAETGKVVTAEEIKAHFEKLRGDEQGIKDAAGAAKSKDRDQGGSGGDNRKEQSGY